MGMIGRRLMPDTSGGLSVRGQPAPDCQACPTLIASDDDAWLFPAM